MATRFKTRAKCGGLVLNRKVGDQITINNGEIIIEVVEIHGNEVRLAFKAHAEIKIDRVETGQLGRKNHV